VSGADHYRRLCFGAATPWQVAATVPARNEAERILACLDALAACLDHVGGGGISLVVNGSEDDTFDRARGWFECSGVPGVLVEEPLPPRGGSVGRARRQAVEACADRLAPGAAIMTTDADCRVAPDWASTNLAELRTADLICGMVIPDPSEYHRLPAPIRRTKSLEGDYMALTRAARQQLDPVPHDPDPAHLFAPGASLAFRMALYRDLGGFPPLAVREDRALAARAEARGWRVRHASAPRVIASCRLDGRAPDGMAGALRARVCETNPLIDELLEPADATVLRYRLRGELRRASSSQKGFAAAWAALERQMPKLKPGPRMRLSELERELPRLEAALSGVTAFAGRQTA